MDTAFRTLTCMKRDGGAWTRADIEEAVARISDGRASEAQVGAWVMAVLLQKLGTQERADLTRAMACSGETFVWGEGAPVCDKHSTGGVGDGTSLVLAPLLAACGLRVPMISGRALAHTFGTLDKLESVEGVSTTLDPDALRAVVARRGFCIAAQSPRIAPADHRLYGLRDAVGCVESLDLIVSSILSKKMVVQPTSLVLDIKLGRGAFNTERAPTLALGAALSAAGNALGMRTTALVTNMDAPLSHAVGHTLEVRAALQVLSQPQQEDEAFLSVVFALGAELLVAESLDTTRDAARARMEHALASGEPLERMLGYLHDVGGAGDVHGIETGLGWAKVRRQVHAPRTGWVAGLDARGVAQAVLGAGGPKAPRSGYQHLVQVGKWVDKGDPLGEVHAETAATADALEAALLGAVSWSDGAPSAPHRVLGAVEGVA
jgi:thymidine phosphorylase